VTDFPFDDAFPLNGMVGSISRLQQNIVPAKPGDYQTTIFVSGDGASDARMMGLDQDLRLLVQSFIRGSHSSARSAAPATSALHPHGDIEIALHGLNLAPEQEEKLRHLIRELVGRRMAGKGATQ
jgi:hypothetical protein